MDFSFTPSAEKFISRMIRLSGGAGGFRLSVSSGGCSGLAAAFDVEAVPRPGDAVIDHGDIKLFLPAESRLLLSGVTIDFVETATRSEFVFHDPKPNVCGCAGDGAAPPHPATNLHQLREF
ncbi:MULTISPECIES: iron-sulfur cluster assembly accessory protein [Rhodopseudomonas]|uniref:Heme biosynthesis protein HemY n=1 Tax=Rhodopseudomonas palustris TaxID=1076 RepID=A0A0D7E1K3_RHOPL|nr:MULTISPECIES: iron-sulfur cluster assembly accessory protein [Rhodopseudomonas]KIZ34683.1 heme biosynthesis protein HemY [Rhodopseudomonas palustris]MDF3810978.1 iron-sulfur cluster assembly accessory protein [Rhodopseudomonas sp. BAL398]WOK15880.1 iron-sulfur cluster assembly accessory protein [Rhodopseudomonas sp. BAL398]